MNLKIKLTQAELDALPEEASIKVYYKYGKKWIWIKTTIDTDKSSPCHPPRLRHEEIEIVPEEEGEK